MFDSVDDTIKAMISNIFDFSKTSMQKQSVDSNIVDCLQLLHAWQ